MRACTAWALQAEGGLLRFKSVFGWLLLFSVVTNVLMLASPLHMIQVYDRVLSSSSLATLFYITLITVAALGLFGVAETVRLKLAQRMSARFATQVSEELFQGLAYQSAGAGAGADSSARLLRDFNNVKGFLAGKTMIALFDLPFVPVFLILLYLIHPQLGLLTFIGMFALASVALANKKMTSGASADSAKANGAAMNFAQAVFSRRDDIRAMGLLPAISARWGQQMAQSLNTGDRAAFQSANFFGLSRFVRQTLQVVTMAWGAFLVINGDMSGGVIFAASMISGRALQPIEQVIGGWESIAAARAAHGELMAFIAQNTRALPQVNLPPVQGFLQAHHLNYAPEGVASDTPILSNINLSVRTGEIVVLVGPSGAGKSTLVRLMAGALGASSGKVLLDGYERENWPPEQWGRAVGYIGQEITLFPGTIAENIARMAIKPDERAVTEAAQFAGAHDVIAKLPQGYMSMIGPGMHELSGGQKQRVAFARALYSRPKVLILDEPNAHLDQAGEQALMTSLTRLRAQGCAILIVAQRQSILKIANRVVTIENGKISRIETVTRDEQSVTEKHGSGEIPREAASSTQRQQA